MKKLYSVIIDTGHGQSTSDLSTGDDLSRLAVRQIYDDVFNVEVLFVEENKLSGRSVMLKRKTLYLLGEIIAEIKKVNKK
jgi:hypothetical protein